MYRSILIEQRKAVNVVRPKKTHLDDGCENPGQCGMRRIDKE